jgi:hypothetical protein
MESTRLPGFCSLLGEWELVDPFLKDTIHKSIPFQHIKVKIDPQIWNIPNILSHSYIPIYMAYWLFMWYVLPIFQIIIQARLKAVVFKASRSDGVHWGWIKTYDIWISNGWTSIHSIHLSGILYLCIYLICIYVYMYICMCYLFCEKSIGKLANKPMVHRFGRDPLSDWRRRSRAGTPRASKMESVKGSDGITDFFGGKNISFCIW